MDNFDISKYRLGKLCLRGHRWHDRQESLRYISTRFCVECLKERPKTTRKSKAKKRTQTVEQRFWSKVDKLGDCWDWQANKDYKGYGSFVFNGKQQKAHRVAWELTYGRIPDSLHCLHRCDRPSCVRPDHLFLGTNADNMADMVRKGRNKPHKGVNNNKAKLTEDQVKQIREIHFAGKATLSEIGLMFKVSGVQVGNIVRRESWKHI